MRAVLDTNILVSACWKPDGLEARTAALALSRQFELCVSAEIVSEYRDVLARKKLARVRTAAAQMLASLERVWTLYQPGERIRLAADDDDNRFLECACAAEAEFLVTGNSRHFPESCARTQVVNARAFLAVCFDPPLDRISP